MIIIVTLNVTTTNQLNYSMAVEYNYSMTIMYKIYEIHSKNDFE